MSVTPSTKMNLSGEDIVATLSALGVDPTGERIEQLRVKLDGKVLPVGNRDSALRDIVAAANTALDAVHGGDPKLLNTMSIGDRVWLDAEDDPEMSGWYILHRAGTTSGMIETPDTSVTLCKENNAPGPYIGAMAYQLHKEQPPKAPQTMSQATKDASNKKRFEVPAINNEKLALMRYLKLNGEDDADYEKVKELEGLKPDSNNLSSTGAVAVFEYNNEHFHVAHATTVELEADALQEFNSNFWRIRKVEGPESVNQHASYPSPDM